MVIRIDLIKEIRILENISIVMYHYVRDIKNSMFPNIKGLEFHKFQRQLDHLQSHYQIISPKDFISALKDHIPLPKNSCLLTFDDGFKDHVQYVLPELLKRRLSGFFFPPGKAIVEKKILDVHGIHFCLEACGNVKQMVCELNDLCMARGIAEKELANYWSCYAKDEQYDDRNIVYIKRMLQVILKEDLRAEIVSELTKKYVKIPSKELSEMLYLSVEDIGVLLDCGMYIGSHGYRHEWLNKLTYEDQKYDIELSINFLKQTGAFSDDWVMCYPYGAYNSETINILKASGCLAAFTDHGGVANLSENNRYNFTRMDTNEFLQ
jgi:peptidoglycan/xylan/chitin deacetylase (PgdA/CDA1 family)